MFTKKHKLDYLLAYGSQRMKNNSKYVLLRLIYQRMVKFQWLLRKRTPSQSIKKVLTFHLSKLHSILKRRCSSNYSAVKRASRQYVVHRNFLSYHNFLRSQELYLLGDAPSRYSSGLRRTREWKLPHLVNTDPSTASELIRIVTRSSKVRRPRLKKVVRKRRRVKLLRLANKVLATPLTSPKNKKTRSSIYAYTFRRRLRNRVPLRLREVRLLRFKVSTRFSRSNMMGPFFFTSNSFNNRQVISRRDNLLNYGVRFHRKRRNRRVRRLLSRRLKSRGRIRRRVYKLRRYSLFTQQAFLTKRRRLRSSLKLRLRNTRPSNSMILTSYKATRKISLAYWRVFTTPFTRKTLLSKPYLRRQWQKPRSRRSRFLTVLNAKLIRNRIQSGVYNLLQKHANSFGRQVYNFSDSTNNDPKQLSLLTRSKKNFTFCNLSMFLHYIPTQSLTNVMSYKFLFKKKIFSFVFPNEIRSSLMRRKKQLTFYKLVYKFKRRSKNKPYYSFTSFNKLFLHHHRLAWNNSSFTNYSDDPFILDSNPNHPTYLGYVPTQDEVLYEDNFKLRGVDTSFKLTEVRIPRIRFKPGYQRMWRRARTALKESLGLRFIYQQQLTKYLTRFYKGSNCYSFSRSEMSLGRILMYSRLLPDLPTIFTFSQQRLIFLNGKYISDIATLLTTNDLVQLVISLWYYVASRWMANWTLKRHKKFKKLVYRKGLASRQKVMKLKKQKSYYTPKWIHLTRYDISGIKPYLEVDYFTLSAAVIYEPFTFDYYSPDDAPDFRLNINRMYNWKYIT